MKPTTARPVAREQPPKAPKARRPRVDPLPFTLAWDGAALASAMRERGVTESWLEDRTGFPARTIRYWKRNKTEPVGSRACVLAEALGVDPLRFYRRVAAPRSPSGS